MFSPEVIRAVNNGTKLPGDDSIWCDSCDTPMPEGFHYLPDFMKVCPDCFDEYKELGEGAR